MVDVHACHADDGMLFVETVMAEADQPDLTTLTVNLLSAYFASNTVDSATLPGMIQTTHDALKQLSAPPPAEVVAEEFVPAVSVRKSLGSPEHILSLIDGRPYKTLTRHLGSNGLTPAEYRERYKLPKDYPMVAKSYSEHRREVAQRLGLGRKIKAADVVAPSSPPPETAEAPPEAIPTVAAKAKPAVRAASKTKVKTTPKKAPAKKALAARAQPTVLEPTPTAPVSAKSAAKPRRTKTPTPAAAQAAETKPARRAPRKQKDPAPTRAT